MGIRNYAFITVLLIVWDFNNEQSVAYSLCDKFASLYIRDLHDSSQYLPAY